VFTINQLSSEVARERHLDFVREAERERRLNELAMPAPRLPTLIAHAQSAFRWAHERRWPIAGRERRLRPVCQD
jgi:hypothetical protein